MRTRTTTLTLLAAGLAACSGGTNGISYLTSVASEPAGAHCAGGGTRIDVGPDVNGNGTLEPSEITDTTYVCNGTNGTNGKDGVDGRDGTDGKDGESYLTAASVEPAGSNCPAGGILVETGPDKNGNGTLDADEVTSSNYVCNGTDGKDGVTYLTSVTIEPKGMNCASGGLRVDTGPDTDGNGTLDVSEVKDTHYVCNGTDGRDGTSYLTEATTEPAGMNCRSGGVRIDAGPDENDNHTLDTSEITSTSYVCNGANGMDGTDGVSTLLNTTVEGSGVHCALGGVRIQSGPDTNDDGTLEPFEVTSTSYVCNSGVGDLVTAFSAGSASSSGSNVTLQQATIDAPAAGTVLAIASTLGYCVSPTTGKGYDCPGSTTGSYGCLDLSTDSASSACGQGSVLFNVTPNVYQDVSRTALFQVRAAGPVTVYELGSGALSQIQFSSSELTLLYVSAN